MFVTRTKHLEQNCADVGHVDGRPATSAKYSFSHNETMQIGEIVISLFVQSLYTVDQELVGQLHVGTLLFKEK